MKIALIGATGMIGSGLLAEALSRGHRVTALARRPETLQAHPSVTAIAADVFDPAQLATHLAGHDAVLSAYSSHGEEDVRASQVRAIDSILQAVERAGVPRLLVVGGAGSLEVAPGLQLVDTPDFPEQWRSAALGARDVLERLRAESTVDWTYLSPSALIAPGQRTGRFRIGAEQLLKNDEGKSEISVEDFSVALIDELEHPAHTRKRFTVGY